jgi:hypothetical protein
LSFVSTKTFNNATGKELADLLSLDPDSITEEYLKSIFDSEDLLEIARLSGY